MKIKITSLLLILVLALCITGCSSETSEDGVVRSKDEDAIHVECRFGHNIVIEKEQLGNTVKTHLFGVVESR